MVGALAGAAVLVTAAALAGPAGVLTATMLTATGILLGRRLLAERRRRRALPDILRGLRTLNRELRAGADPLTAVGGAGRAGRGAGARVLARLMVLMQSGADGDPVDGGAEPEDRVLDRESLPKVEMPLSRSEYADLPDWKPKTRRLKDYPF